MLPYMRVSKIFVVRCGRWLYTSNLLKDPMQYRYIRIELAHRVLI